MALFTPDAIRQMTDETTYLEGKRLYDLYKIAHMTEETLMQTRHVEAVVKDTPFPEDVFIAVDGSHTIQEIYCSCDRFYHSSSAPCRHLVALLLEAPAFTSPPAVSGFRTPAADNTVKNQFLEYFSPFQSRVEDVGTQIHADFLISFPVDNRKPDVLFPVVQVKIGENQRYAVKNIYQFIEAMKNEAPFRLTPSLKFDPVSHYFSEENLHVLQLLASVLRHEEWGSSFQEQWIARSGAKKEIAVPPYAVEKLFSLLDLCPNAYITDTHGERPWHVTDNWPYSFFLSYEKESDTLTFSTPQQETPFFISDSRYCLWDGQLYCPDKELARTAAFAQRMLMQAEGQRLVFSRQEFHDTFLHWGAPLMNHRCLEMDEKLEENLHIEPLQTALYLSKGPGGKIAGELIYRYGFKEYSAFRPDPVPSAEDSYFMPRDRQQEHLQLQRLQQKGFLQENGRFVLSSPKNIIGFLSKELAALRPYMDIFMSEEVENMLIPGDSLSLLSDIHADEGWMELSLTSSVTDALETPGVWKAIQEGKEFYITDDDRYLPLDDELLQRLAHALQQMPKPDQSKEEGAVRYPAHQAFNLDKHLSGTPRWQTTLDVDDMLENIRRAAENHKVLAEPSGVKLRTYQREGIQWMKQLAAYRFGGILADDMGLGKTLQALGFIATECKENPGGEPFVIIAPSSLLYNWKKETERFFPSLNATVVSGSKKEREQQIQQQSDIFITSYPLLRRDVEWYEETFFRGVLLDEAQAVKNAGSKTAKAVKQLRSKYCFALSGTPVENRLDELRSIFSVVMPGLFPNKKLFSFWSPEEVRDRASPFIMRRTKKEVLQELPEKVETTTYCDLLTSQADIYKKTLQNVQQEAGALLEEGADSNRMHLLSLLTRLRQICCHPSLVEPEYQSSSGKLEELVRILHEGTANGQRVLVFSQFTSMLALIKNRLAEEDIDYYYLDGSTPGEERVRLAETFNEEKGPDVFLISLRAGGTGLNLTGADTVVLYDLWWNPAVEMQAADRAHRLGQTKTVQVIRLITHETIEEKIQHMQEEKRHLYDQVITDEQSSLNTLSENDIRLLLTGKAQET
ncbi:DEAD/DEAH box helicase [Marinococcus luteus]|uniref:DEAD/DEAH box helicase n=1 Tax=Marinococcus luteus TaxID=1122204 RepID=UPI002ACD1A81|nr:SNF2-related protein [Marinococcus luteus]MDZ5784287.1 SNF2-related protein [Marinococcus luteus]